jgi:hypothetical protein
MLESINDVTVEALDDKRLQQEIGLKSEENGYQKIPLSSLEVYLIDEFWGLQEISK